MRTAIFLMMSTTLILSTSHSALAQASASVGPRLVLIKGDTSNSSTPNCSFITTTELVPVPIVQGLLTTQTGYSPNEVETQMGFIPDRPYSNGVLQWTAVRGGNYVRAVVNFRNNGAITRFFTMATNYQQPNEKRCQWEVRETR